jgi:hypothetical protein
VAVTFSLQNKQKVNRGGKTKFLNIKGAFSKKKNYREVRQNSSTLYGGKDLLTHYLIV